MNGMDAVNGVNGVNDMNGVSRVNGGVGSIVYCHVLVDTGVEYPLRFRIVK